jgi:hypothetical protein
MTDILAHPHDPELDALLDEEEDIQRRANGKPLRPDPAARLKADNAELTKIRRGIDRKREQIKALDAEIADLTEDARIMESYVKTGEKLCGTKVAREPADVSRP